MGHVLISSERGFQEVGVICRSKISLHEILNCSDFLTGNPVCTEVEPMGEWFY